MCVDVVREVARDQEVTPIPSKQGDRFAETIKSATAQPNHGEDDPIRALPRDVGDQQRIVATRGLDGYA